MAVRDVPSQGFEAAEDQVAAQGRDDDRNPRRAKCGSAITRVKHEICGEKLRLYTNPR